VGFEPFVEDWCRPYYTEVLSWGGMNLFTWSMTGELPGDIPCCCLSPLPGVDLRPVPPVSAPV
jgi:hypothetical protein